MKPLRQSAILLYMLSQRVHASINDWQLPSIKDSRRIMERFQTVPRLLSKE